MATFAQKRDEQTANRLERLERVAALRLSGVRQQYRIARELGVSKATISRDFDALNELYQQRAAEDITAAKGEDLERLDVLLESLWGQATGPKAKAHVVDRVLAILARRAAMHGYDAPTRNEHTGRNGEPIQIEATDARERLRAKLTELTQRVALAPPAAQGESESGAENVA